MQQSDNSISIGHQAYFWFEFCQNLVDESGQEFDYQLEEVASVIMMLNF